MKKVMISLVSVLFILVLAACGGDSDTVTYTADLNGVSQKPAPVTTAATGTATATLEGSTFSVEGTFKDLESDLNEVAGSSAHIHQVENDEGTGGIVFNLDVTSADDRSGSFEGSSDLSDAQIALLNNGDLYINIHTVDNGAGEIRGDLSK